MKNFKIVFDTIHGEAVIEIKAKSKLAAEEVADVINLSEVLFHTIEEEEMNNELYSHNRHNGFDLFVESPDGEYEYYEGTAQLNGTTFYTSKSLTGDGAERKLIEQINRDEEY